MKMKRNSIIGGVITLLLYFSLVYRTGYTEASIKKNIFTGEVTIDTTYGFNIEYPWVLVSHVPTNPRRMCIESKARIQHCKLIHFIPSRYMDFVEREGFRYYWFDNRISFNSGHKNEYRGIYDTFYGYTFTDEKVSFIY